MACIKSLRSKLSSPQMTKAASLLASMLTRVPRAKHTSLGSMACQRASVPQVKEPAFDRDAVMLTHVNCVVLNSSPPRYT